MCSLESGVLYRESVVWGGGKAFHFSWLGGRKVCWLSLLKDRMEGLLGG